MPITLIEAKKKLRNLLSDNETDKYVYRKKVYGKCNGANKFFKTFERRRVNSFTTTNPFPIGLYKNGVILSNTDVSQDDPLSGEFELLVAPTANEVIEATYYHQDFLDSELEEFLENAAMWLKGSTDFTTIENGLIPAGLHYAGQEAYTRLALWYSRRLAEVYLTEDLPDEQTRAAQNTYLELAKFFHSKAVELRDQYYSGRGEEHKPQFGVVRGNVKNVTPSR